jgi:hypothetical protein
MSSAGTNGTDGTDLTTTLTTQGDLVYRDGSGLQRLGAGTAGQVLQTGGTGANPSWGTVSSDFVKLAEATASSSTEINFEDYYSSTYQSYQILGYNIQNSIAAELGFQFATGAGKTYATTDYYSLTHGAYTDHSGTTASNWNNRNTNNNSLRSSFDAGTSSTQLCHFRANFYNLNDASGAYKSFDCFKRISENTWVEANMQSSGEARNVTLANNVITGIKILPTSGNYVKGKFVLYGIK